MISTLSADRQQCSPICVDQDTDSVFTRVNGTPRALFPSHHCDQNESILTCMARSRHAISPSHAPPTPSGSGAPSSCHIKFTSALDKYFQSCPQQMRRMCGTSDRVVENLCQSNTAQVDAYTERLRDLTESGRCEAPPLALDEDQEKRGVCGAGTMLEFGHCVVKDSSK